jgi:RNA polymerase subunit RPABC4/transcription elongation factor Spt4/HSP20 family molecular chaperone IbpA
MFNKKQCKKCKSKINSKFDYCPYCGTPVDLSKEDFGMLGKNDIADPFEEMSKNMFGGISGKMFNKMLGGAMKMLEKELQKNMQNSEAQPKTNFELYINGKKISPDNIKITRKELPEKEAKKIQNQNFDDEKIKKFSKLPKKEPSTNIRRLSNKVIYEINIPGVSSIKDISIIKLEGGIEIRAIAKDQAYQKVISIDLPIKKYKLEDEKLILELED